MLFDKFWRVERAPIVQIILLRTSLELGLKLALELVWSRPPRTNTKSPLQRKKNNVVPDNPAVDYGFDDDFIGDNSFTFYTRRGVHNLQGWRAFVRERRSCTGFLVPDLPIPKRLSLVLRALYGQNWQKVVLSASEKLIEQSGAALTGYNITTPPHRREFLRLFGVWANSEFREGLRELALRGGFLDLD